MRAAKRTPRLVFLALFFFTFGLYLLTLTQVHTFDALSYVLSVERKPWTEVFHPHHLAYGPLGALALTSGRSLGYTGGAALPMQLINSAAGAAGVAVFGHLIWRRTGRLDLAVALGLFLAASYAYWYYAVEIEVYTVAALLLIMCLAILVDPEPPTRSGMLALGLAQGGAVLFHQTNVLLCVPVVVWLIVRNHGTTELRNQEPGTRNQEPNIAEPQNCGITEPLDSRRQETENSGEKRSTHYSLLTTEHTTNLQSPPATSQQPPATSNNTAVHRPSSTVLFGIYAFALGLVVAVPYLWVGFGVSGFRSVDAFMGWMTEYARTGWWGGPVTTDKWAKLGQGLSETIADSWGRWIGVALAAIGVLALVRGRSWGQGGRGQMGSVVALWAWIVLYGAFFFWWEPDNIEFWIASLPPALMLLGLALQRGRPWGLLFWLVLALALAELSINGTAIRKRGDASTDLQRVVARALAAQSTPADLLIVPDGLQELYLPYYENRENFISLNQALFDAGNSWDGACATLHQRIEMARAAGATSLIADEALHPPVELLSRHQLAQGQVDACFAPYQAELRLLALPPQVPAYLRLPFADEYANGPGWDFRVSPLGWRAANVDRSSFDDGWVLVPGVDPSVTSPLLRIDTARYRAVEITLAHQTQVRDAQLFFIGEDGLADEARSVRWQLGSGAASQTYRLELEGAPGWIGIVTRLRIDPVGVGDEGEVRIVSVRLVPRE
jgi:hypothetical protein